MRRAEVALEGAPLFREAADPEVDLLDTGNRETVFAGRPITMPAEEFRGVGGMLAMSTGPKPDASQKPGSIVTAATR